MIHTHTVVASVKTKTMNKMKILICFLFCAVSLFAQEVEIPDDVRLKTAEDYKQTEQLVINSAQWLVTHTISYNPKKRKEINTFLMEWMSGSPSVSIELISGVVPVNCADCLMSFMSGWTKYSLENNYSKDKVECALAGVKNVIAFYTNNKSEIGEKSDIENLIKKNKNGKLKKYIESRI